jgi:predicted RNA polymerase sigma factor
MHQKILNAFSLQRHLFYADRINSPFIQNRVQKIVSVLCKLFGIEYIEIAEDIVSDTFLLASELWGLKGLPENPTAWLYVVAKNKTRDYLKRNSLFAQTISKEIKSNAPTSEEIEIDLSSKNINDSQLAMIFVVCHPCNPRRSANWISAKSSLWLWCR